LTREQQQRLARMLKAHFASVWRVGRRMGLSNGQAEEIAQEAYALAARRLDDIGTEQERAYLLGVAVRLAGNARRRMHVRLEGQASDSCNALAIDPLPLAEQALVRKQECAALDGVLQTMSPLLSEVLILYEIEELTLPEIADALQIPLGTAASRLRRARDEFLRRAQHLDVGEVYAKEQS
jgi:RNA polymerase sigma-70 factor (ECF subfamily)